MPTAKRKQPVSTKRRTDTQNTAAPRRTASLTHAPARTGRSPAPSKAGQTEGHVRPIPLPGGPGAVRLPETEAEPRPAGPGGPRGAGAVMGTANKGCRQREGAQLREGAQRLSSELTDGESVNIATYVSLHFLNVEDRVG